MARVCIESLCPGGCFKTILRQIGWKKTGKKKFYQRKNVCLSITNVCLSVTNVCLSVTNVCLSITNVCLSVTHTDQYHSLPRLWRKFGKEAGWTNKQEKSLFGHLHPRRASNGRRRRPICEYFQIYRTWSKWTGYLFIQRTKLHTTVQKLRVLCRKSSQPTVYLDSSILVFNFEADH